MRQELTDLPEPDASASARSDALRARMLDEVDRDGFLPFPRFMELALYAPGLGYYASGAEQFGTGGDFVTAPETSALFGRTLAAQIAQVRESGVDSILELGAGRGLLAADLLRELDRLELTPQRYLILEVSAELHTRQREVIGRIAPALLDRVQWLTELPQRFEGVVLGNEVLDALPVARVVRRGGTLYELGIVRAASADDLAWAERVAGDALVRAAEPLQLPEDYITELHLAAHGLVRSLGDALERGVIIFFDYGFPRREYYHPQRSLGTLMCHYRHRAHDDPLRWIGLQDITAHLDFSALAASAEEAGLDVLGFTQQAHFLIDCGILDRLAEIDPADILRFAPASAAVQRLLSPAEMGEIFKVIAFGRGIDPPLMGFRSANRRVVL